MSGPPPWGAGWNPTQITLRTLSTWSWSEASRSLVRPGQCFLRLKLQPLVYAKWSLGEAVNALTSSLHPPTVSSGGGPGPIKPVVPPQPLPSQPPPAISAAHPYQVSFEGQKPRRHVPVPWFPGSLA